MLIIDTNSYTKNEYEAEFQTILANIESHKSEMDLFFENQDALFDQCQSESYNEAERVFRQKFGITYDEAMRRNRDYFALAEEF